MLYFSSSTESRSWNWFHNQTKNNEVAGTPNHIVERKQFRVRPARIPASPPEAPVPSLVKWE